MIRRLFPSPLVSAGLVAMWLLLNESLSAGNWVFGVFLGWFLPVVFSGLRPQRPRIRHPLIIARLILTVGKDVLLSNLQVARQLIRAPQHTPVTDFVVVPLELRDPHGLASLAMITTVIPGSVWCEVARDGSAVILHVWDVPDPAAYIAYYKATYEAPLLKIYTQ